MKEKILKLRNEGKTYNEIKKILGCSKGTISFHCGVGQKAKNNIRRRKSRASSTLVAKIERFKSTPKRILSEKARFFQRRKGSRLIPRVEYNFTYQDVINKIGEAPVCYLTGKALDISNPKAYSLDHIIPPTKGGNNLLSNLGVIDYKLNRMKNDLTKEEFIEICKNVLIHNGYELIKT